MNKQEEIINTSEGTEVEEFTTKERLKEYMNLFDDGFGELAKYLEITYQSLNKKLNNHVDFKRSEIKKIKERYSLDAAQVDYIFFQD